MSWHCWPRPRVFVLATKGVSTNLVDNSLQDRSKRLLRLLRLDSGQITLHSDYNMTDSTASEAGIEVLVPLPIHDKARHQDPGMDKKVAKDDLLSRAPSSRSSQEPALLTPSGDDSSGSLYCPSEEPETEPGSKARKKAPAKRARPQSAPLSKVHPSRDTKADASLRRKLASADKAEASDIKPDVSTPLRVKSSPGASDGTASNSQAKTRWTDKQKFAMCMALIDAGRESADYKKIAEGEHPNSVGQFVDLTLTRRRDQPHCSDAEEGFRELAQASLLQYRTLMLLAL